MIDTKKTEATDLKELKMLRKQIHATVKELQTYKEIGIKRSTIILSQDALGKQLEKKNKEKLKTYQKASYEGKLDEKLTAVSDILFRNFDIQAATIEVLKCYIDEYFDRFVQMDQKLSKTLLLLDKYLVASAEKNNA